MTVQLLAAAVLVTFTTGLILVATGGRRRRVGFVALVVGLLALTQLVGLQLLEEMEAGAQRAETNREREATRLEERAARIAQTPVVTPDALLTLFDKNEIETAYLLEQMGLVVVQGTVSSIDADLFARGGRLTFDANGIWPVSARFPAPKALFGLLPGDEVVLVCNQVSGGDLGVSMGDCEFWEGEVGPLGPGM